MRTAFSLALRGVGTVLFRRVDLDGKADMAILDTIPDTWPPVTMSCVRPGAVTVANAADTCCSDNSFAILEITCACANMFITSG